MSDPENQEQRSISSRIFSWVVTVTVLIIAALIVLPGTSRPRRGYAKEYRARAEIKAISNGLQQYRVHYGRWPFSGEGREQKDNKKLMSVLAFRTNAPPLRAENPKRIIFVDPHPISIKDGEYVDPWGNPYRIFLDVDEDGVIQVGSVRLTNSMAVWSKGRNGIDETGEGDDIASWK